MADHCKECGQELRVECPQCGRMVLVHKSMFVAHEKATVHTSHITWGGCPASNKAYKKDY